MKYTYCFLGHGRTGSTSLWRMLRDHPQISTSIEKEYIRDHPDLDNYIDNAFLIKDNTKVLFDGVVEFTETYKAIRDVKEIDRICCIYILRDLKSKVVSTLDLINKLYDKKIEKRGNIHNDDGSIDYNTKAKDVALYNINQYDFLLDIEELTGKDNILVMKLEDVEQKQSGIYKFLDVDDVKLKFPKINTAMHFNPTIQQLKDKVEMLKWEDSFFKKTVQEISDEQIELIHERYKVV